MAFKTQVLFVLPCCREHIRERELLCLALSVLQKPHREHWSQYSTEGKMGESSDKI